MELFLGALFFALIFTLIFTAGYQGERNYKNLFWAFLFLFLPLWALVIWIPPIGPVYWGVAWLQIMVLAFVITLFVLAVTPIEHHRRYRMKRPQTQQEEITSGVSAFFWIFAVVVLFSVYLGYTFMERGVAH